MSVDQKDVIDVVSIDEDDNVVLTISDHLPWDTENVHLLVLQEKINAYLAAIESGELQKSYPKANNRNIIIRIIAMNSPNKEGQDFLNQVDAILKSAGYGFEFKQRPFPSDLQ